MHSTYVIEGVKGEGIDGANLQSSQVLFSCGIVMRAEFTQISTCGAQMFAKISYIYATDSGLC